MSVLYDKLYFYFHICENNCIYLRYDAISTSFTPGRILLRWNLLSRAGHEALYNAFCMQLS